MSKYQERYLLFCKTNKINPDDYYNKSNFSDYIEFINFHANKYKKNKGINTISDHNDFTNYIKNNLTNKDE